MWLHKYICQTDLKLAGSIGAKKYLAGASMPATCGMQYVSLASRWLYVLF